MGSEFDDELLELIGGGDSDKQAGGAPSSRKRNRESGGSGKGSGGASGSAGKTKKRKVVANNDSDDEPESEEGGAEEPGEKYPLDGKYIDEEDRETLLAKTEVEREEILAARMDEMEAIRDRKHVDRLRAQQLAGVAGVDREREGGETKRAARGTGKDKTKDKTLSALKAKRKAKDEKKRTRASTPKTREGRSSSPMDMEMSDPSDESDDEDGQISRLDQEDERLFGKPTSQSARQREKEEREDNLPLTTEHLQKIWLTRDALARHSVSPFFEGIVKGCWVRYLIGQEAGRRIYRICQIKGLSPAPKAYKITPDRTVNQVFELKHGKAEKVWQMDRSSNEPWGPDEFKRLMDTYKQEELALPTRREVDERYAEMQELIKKPVTEEDVSAMIARKRQLLAAGATTSGLNVAERSRLTAERTLAMRRQDWDEVRRVEKLLGMAPEGSDSARGTPGPEGEGGEAAKDGAVNGAAPDRRAAEPDRLAKVNERNRKANAEAIRKAELADAERKRRDRKMQKQQLAEGGVDMRILDPSARLRTVPRVWESATPGSRPGTPNPATLGTGTATPLKGVSPAPTSKLANAINAATFETKIIESIEVDLGDF
ncbi:hypothetical protein C8R46DRAFT_1098266 [Mycena filopes]|nr:hypothetical protein C8R46DRAFT_1098266 [Mycena filopes]